MRILGTVTVLVVKPVASHPRKKRALEGHRPENPQRKLDRTDSLKRAMREETVEPGGYADHGEQIHPGKQSEVNPAQTPPPNQNGSGHQTNERDGHSDERPEARIACGINKGCRTRELRKQTR